MRDVSATKTMGAAVPTTEARRLVLVVVYDGTRRDYPLPSSGEVTIGRAEECEICIAHSSLSRRHVTIALGPELCLREEGSKNGTRLRGERLEPGVLVPIGASGDSTPGDVFEPGTLVCFLQARESSLAREAKRDVIVEPVLVDPAMKRTYELLFRFAAGDISILLLGETGVGKEVAARAVHASSPRAAAPFVALNCAALSSTLLESELFGHERGAFTGASKAKEGLFEAARGGTVLLDEVGELPPETQAKLLRVLEERAVTRVGATRAISVDVRVVSATNRDLGRAVEEGTFRRDLYFRLNGVSVEIPPLRHRRSEIVPLAKALLLRAAERLDRPVPTLSREAAAILEAWHWPGNVREVRNVLERAMLMTTSKTILPEHLGLPERVPPPPPPPEASGASAPLRAELDALERQRILDALAEAGGNQTKAAKLLRMPRRTFILRLETYGVPRPRKRG
ncbi:MAG: sigma 54-interacting transcriptional regulator [Labilithrix sp.]